MTLAVEPSWFLIVVLQHTLSLAVLGSVRYAVAPVR